MVHGRACKSDQIEHEVRITDLRLLFHDSRFQRGVKVGDTEADAFMIRDGRRCYIEVDNSGKMTVKQMQAKWRRYENVNGFILVVTVTEKRMERLCKTANAVKDVALFTTFQRLQSDMKEPWVDFYGKSLRI